MFTDFGKKTTLRKLVAMATKKRLSLIYELENFANIYLRKVTKFQGDGLFRFGVLSNLLAWRWKTPPLPGMNRVKGSVLMCQGQSGKFSA